MFVLTCSGPECQQHGSGKMEPHRLDQLDNSSCKALKRIKATRSQDIPLTYDLI